MKKYLKYLGVAILSFIFLVSCRHKDSNIGVEDNSIFLSGSLNTTAITDGSIISKSDSNSITEDGVAGIYYVAVIPTSSNEQTSYYKLDSNGSFNVQLLKSGNYIVKLLDKYGLPQTELCFGKKYNSVFPIYTNTDLGDITIYSGLNTITIDGFEAVTKEKSSTFSNTVVNNALKTNVENILAKSSNGTTETVNNIESFSLIIAEDNSGDNNVQERLVLNLNNTPAEYGELDFMDSIKLEVATIDSEGKDISTKEIYSSSNYLSNEDENYTSSYIEEIKKLDMLIYDLTKENSNSSNDFASIVSAVNSGNTLADAVNKNTSNNYSTTFEGASYSANASIKGELSNISIESAPDKTSYALGEALDLTGLVVKAEYANGNGYTETIDHDDLYVYGYDPSTAGAGTYTVKVSFNGKIATFNIVVSKYTATIDQKYINSDNQDELSFSLDNYDDYSKYNYTINDNDSSTDTVAGNGTISTNTISDIDVSSLSNGTLTLTVYLTDTDNNVGAKVTSTVIKDTDAPTLSKDSLTLSDITGSGVKLKWTAATDDSTEAENLKYKVVYYTQNSNEVHIFKDWTANITTTNISGLNGVTNYMCRVFVKDEAGNISKYSDGYFTTLDGTAPTVDDGTITASNITADGFSLSWAKAEDSITSQENLQYKVVYSTSDDVSSSTGTTAKDWTADITSINISGLTAEKRYYYNVFVKDETGNISAYNGGNKIVSNFRYDMSNNKATVISYIGSETNITIPSAVADATVVSIGDNAFYQSELISVIIPDSVTSIGKLAFAYSTNLKSVTIPNSVTSIESYAFLSSALESVTIPNSITSIKEAAFSSNNLKSIIIPRSVTSIEGSAFTGNKLENITIPNSVISIGSNAFSGNSDLSTVTFEHTNSDSLTFEENIFRNCNDVTFKVNSDEKINDAIKTYADNYSYITIVDETAPKVGNDGNITVSDTTSSGFTLTWTKAEDYITSQSDLQYKVVYSTSDDISSSTDGTSTQDWTANMTTTNISGLTAETTYYYNVFVKDDSNNISKYAGGNVTTDEKHGWQTVGGDEISQGRAQYNEIVIDSNGKPYIIYTEDGDEVVVKTYNSSSNSLENVGNGTFNYEYVSMPYIAVDKSGTPYITYRYQEDEDEFITIKKYDGSSWVNVDGFSEDHISSNLNIATDEDGTLYMVYQGDRSLNYNAIVKKYDPISNSWENVGNAASQSKADSISISFDNNKNPYIVYRDSNLTRKIIMKMYNSNSNSWENVGNGTVSDNNSVSPKMAISKDGVPYVAYIDLTVNKTFVKVYNSNSNSWENVGNGTPTQEKVNGYDIAVDNSGNPYIIYSDSDISDGDKTAVKMYDGSSWVKVGEGKINEKSCTSPTITFDNDGNPYILYGDGTNGYKAIVKKY